VKDECVSFVFQGLNNIVMNVGNFKHKLDNALKAFVENRYEEAVRQYKNVLNEIDISLSKKSKLSRKDVVEIMVYGSCSFGLANTYFKMRAFESVERSHISYCNILSRYISDIRLSPPLRSFLIRDYTSRFHVLTKICMSTGREHIVKDFVRTNTTKLNEWKNVLNLLTYNNQFTN
jgi:hypothetical protein